MTNLTEYQMKVFDRLFSKTEYMDNGCIEWRGGYSSKGYGAIKYNGRQEGTHRVSYELCIGEIPDGKWILHSCDNPACVNPEHLFLGDALLNKHDSMNKDRHVYCQKNGASLLNNQQVTMIKQLLDDGSLTQEEIGRQFNVAQPTISQIKTGQTWGRLQ